ADAALFPRTRDALAGATLQSAPANPVRGRLTVGRLTLDQEVGVRIPAPQLLTSAARHHNSQRSETPRAAQITRRPGRRGEVRTPPTGGTGLSRSRAGRPEKVAFCFVDREARRGFACRWTVY